MACMGVYLGSAWQGLRLKFNGKILFERDKKTSLHIAARYNLSIFNSDWLVGLEFNSPVNTFMVMSIRAVYLMTFLLDRMTSKRLTSTCAFSFTRKWQLPYLNQRKGQIVCRKYYIIILHERMWPDPAETELATSWSPVSWAEAGMF